MSSAENIFSEDPSKPVDSSKPNRSFSHGLLADSHANSHIASMRNHDQVGPLLVHCSLEQDKETPRDNMVRTLADDLKGLTKFSHDSEVAGWLKAGMQHQLNAGGAAAADSLAGDISKKLPDGMQLIISQDPKLEASVKKYAEENGEPNPDYVRFIEVTKDGKSLGKFGISMRSSVQELAMALGDAKKLAAGSAEASSLITESYKLYERGGAQAADNLAEEINKTLPAGMKLKITDDAEFKNKTIAKFNKDGNPIPDYIRLFELFDKDGKSLGQLGIGHFDKKKPKRVAPSKSA